MLTPLKRLSALVSVLALGLVILTSSSIGQAQNPYDNLPYDQRMQRQQGQYPQPRNNTRPQNMDPARAERDYIVQENDPYLAPQRQMSPRQQYCQQLEQRLARDWNSRNRGTEDLPRIEEEMRKARGVHRKLERTAERRKCYEYFLFSKTVRRTRRCFAMHKKIQKAQRKLATLEAQYQRIAGSQRGNNSQRNELVSALARNGCGRQYQRAAQQNSWGIFDFLQNDNTRVDPRGRLERHHMPFATYRTMCVRMCDGYYFPVSFSTMQSKFGQDDNACQNKCAAPAKLFVYENPGGSVETMTSIDGIAYSELPNAWRYRKTFIKGCSCKMADYDPAALQKFERDLALGKRSNAEKITKNNSVGPNIGNNARAVNPETTDKPQPGKPKTPGPKAEVPGDSIDAIAAQLAQSGKTAPKPQRAKPQ